MGQVRLYNVAARRWEWFTIHHVRMPWEGAWTRMRWTLRNVARFYRNTLFPADPSESVYEFDPVTLNIRDPKRERRMRRRDRRDRLIAKAANALNSMVEMQKFIK